MSEVDSQTPALEEPLFDPGLKKKKKKKTVTISEDPLGVEGGADAPSYGNEDTAPTQEHPTLDSLGNDFSDLKKKKKKKATFDLDELEPSINGDSSSAKPAVDGDDLAPALSAASLGDFSDMKKKKKSKKAAFDLEAFEKELEDSSKPAAAEGDDDAEDGAAAAADYDEEELGDDVFATPSGGGAVAAAGDDSVETWHGTDRDYTYAELLGRIMRTLHAQNPELSSVGGRKRYTIVPPSVHREGTKKTIFANVADICKRMHRQPEHVIQFLFAELGTTGSVDGEKRLVIKGRFQPKQIENVLRRYIVEYVTCKTCKSPDTIFTKENRLYFIQCESCGSKRSVSAIQGGFKAQIGKRKKKAI